MLYTGGMGKRQLGAAALQIVEGQTFVDPDIVYLSGKHFRNCRFDGATMNFSGGPMKFEDCTFANCRWGPIGDAAATLVALHTLFRTDGVGPGIINDMLFGMFRDRGFQFVLPDPPASQG